MNAINPVIYTTIGVILGAFVTKIFEVWIKRQEHQRALQKEFFLRKIEVAEKIIVRNENYASEINKVLSVLNIILERNMEVDLEACLSVFKNAESLFNEISSQRDSPALLSNLYFNINYDMDESIMKAFYEKQMNFNNLSAKIRRENITSDEMDNIIEGAKVEILEFGKLLHKVQEYLHCIQNGVIEEMKKYNG